MEQAISKSLGQRRLALRLVAGFGITALILSAVGIYGVLAYSVALRRREIGVRMALGSSRAQASGLVLRHAAWMVLMGVIPGLGGAWAAPLRSGHFLWRKCLRRLCGGRRRRDSLDRVRSGHMHSRLESGSSGSSGDASGGMK